jgi:hypothetical protein
MPYRLYRRDPVYAGKWYLTVPCSECDRTLYLLDDNTNGQDTVKIAGDGEISVGCPRCKHEGLYPATSMKAIQADEDLVGGRPPRVAPSPSSRKPLIRTYPKAKTTFGVGYIEDRPKAASIVGRIITSWADIELQCARLLAELMGTNVPAAAAVFASLRNSRAQSDAMDAAAKTVLQDADYELFAAHMARRASLEKERNDLAHGCFGVSESIPNDIVWVSQSDFITFTANFTHDPLAFDKFREKQFVYELGTLERIAQEIEQFHHQLGLFRGFLTTRHDPIRNQQFRSVQYPQLCNQAHIRQALDRIRTAKKASQAHAPKNPSKHKRR